MLAASAVCFTSCEDEDNEVKLGNWVDSRKEFPGVARGSAVCFTIDNVAYVGTGANTDKTEERQRHRDFYSCHVTVSESDWLQQRQQYADYGKVQVPMAWSAKWERTANGVSSMPDEAPARNGAVAFAINGKGYVGLGYDGTNYLKDFWEFTPGEDPDPSQYPSLPDTLKSKFPGSKTGRWRRVADYPGDSCRYAVAFVIDNIAYVGTGQDYDDNILSDFYKFDGKTWSVINSIGVGRSQATAFSYNGYGYVFGGVSSDVVDAFSRYDPKKDLWEDLHSTSNRTDFEFDDEYVDGCLTTYGCTSFVVQNYGITKAYVATGNKYNTGGRYCWEYDFDGDYWIQKTNFEGMQRKLAVSFVLNFGDLQIPFVTTGCANEISVAASGGLCYKDTWLLNPYEYPEEKD